jgi:hypothetical protein
LTLQRAVQEVYGLSLPLAALVSAVGVGCCGHSLQLLNLDGLAKHGRIEHDGSLSHRDTPPGGTLAPTTVDQVQIMEVLSYSSDGRYLTIDDFARARADTEGNLTKPLDTLHAATGQGEIALTLLTMGDGQKVTKERLQAWWGNEQLPVDWAPPSKGSVSLLGARDKADAVKKRMVAYQSGKGSSRTSSLEDLD